MTFTYEYFQSASELGTPVLEIWIQFPNVSERREFVISIKKDRANRKHFESTYKTNGTPRDLPRKHSYRAVPCGVARQQRALKYRTENVVSWQERGCKPMFRFAFYVSFSYTS